MEYFIGVDVGGSKIAVALCDSELKIINKCKIENNESIPYTEIVKKLADTIISFTASNNVLLSDVKGVGVTIAGVFDLETYDIILTPNLDWEGYNLVKDLGAIIKRPIFMANDADAAVLGELYAGVKLNDFVMITLGTGVGGGLVLDGKLYADKHKDGLELGHVTLMSGGRKCGCGNLGCIEAYCSTKSLIAQVSEAVTEKSSLYSKAKDGSLTGLDIFGACANGDKEAISCLDKFTDYLADASYSLIMSFRTEAIVIGGGICENEEFLLNPLRKKVAKKLEAFGRIKETKVLKAVLGNDAGLVGAASLGKS